MLSEGQLKQRFIRDNLMEIKKVIQGKDYNGEMHEALKDIFSYIISINDFSLLLWFLENVKNAPARKAVDLVINRRKSDEIFRLARTLSIINADKYLIKELEDEIIKLGDPDYIYLFAINVKNISVLKFIDAIIKSGREKNIYGVAKYLYNRGTDTEILEKLADAMSGKYIDYVYYFIRDVVDIKVQQLVELILKVGSANYIFETAKLLSHRHMDEVMLERFVEAIIKAGDPSYMNRFAKEVKGAPVERLAKAVIATRDLDSIYDFARDVESAPIEILADAIIESGLARFIYPFSKIKKKLPITKLEDALIKIGDCRYITLFAKDVEGASVEKLANAIINSGNAEYMYIFAINVKDAPINKLYEAILTTNDWDYIEKFAQTFNLDSNKDNLLEIEYKKVISSGSIAATISKNTYNFRRSFLEYLLNNVDVDFNQIILRVYYEFLMKNLRLNDKEIETLDLEYQTCIESLRQGSDIVKPKTKKKSLSVYSLLYDEKKS